MDMMQNGITAAEQDRVLVSKKHTASRPGSGFSKANSSASEFYNHAADRVNTNLLETAGLNVTMVCGVLSCQRAVERERIRLTKRNNQRAIVGIGTRRGVLASRGLKHGPHDEDQDPSRYGSEGGTQRHGRMGAGAPWKSLHQKK